jgi:hypothetical protein
MKRIWIVPCLFAGLSVAIVVPAAVLAAGGDGGFDGVVRSIEYRYHAHATRIPFMGLISLVARKSTQGGVSGMHVAEIEEFKETVNGDELDRMVEEKLGSGWERMIRETSRNGKEQTLIFSRAEDDRMGLFVVNLDDNEMGVVQVSVDPKHLNESLCRYRHHHSSEDADGRGASD